MTLEEQILQIVKQEVKPAIGCTEPISTALACAIIKEHLQEDLKKLTLFPSGNLLKNTMAVTIPNTSSSGIKMAAAMGYVCGDSKLGLEVLKYATPQDEQTAKNLLSKITICLKKNVPNLYIEAIGESENNTIRVIIEHEHTFIKLIEKNQKTLLHNTYTQQNYSQQEIFKNLNLEDIYNLACSIDEEKIAFIADSAVLNTALSQEGLSKDYGLKIGRTFQKHIQSQLVPNDLMTQILIQTTAASDARMGGAPLPAMTNSGSGNQGITATMPVVVVAKHLQKEKDLNRALFLSHLTAIYIHSKLPKLSALCAVTTAGIGSYAGIAWLFTKEFKIVSKGICNMIGDISGILCDGAGSGCSMKVSTTTQAAFKALLLALEDSTISGKEGIVANKVDESIQNLCDIASKSMLNVDSQILEIMMSKNLH
ncbi:serine dehydratase subunit alpha family protein [Helicobacter anatolicus]|uniref:L-cysteine desulfidase family protein n=1 Tax=Helicobacter anatolicus TaxID=2905874 RepID=UPI001E38A8E6|nr:L-serine ammonia-lyase, iron-sulfur-dependent, subunit alpha [Helicobacter anatolicus]MCE3039804.1 L-serine ammonia-lyase, iron-sulfur-dependent, subunit alpha [Helicobacter anatolicus]